MGAILGLWGAEEPDAGDLERVCAAVNKAGVNCGGDGVCTEDDVLHQACRQHCHSGDDLRAHKSVPRLKLDHK